MTEQNTRLLRFLLLTAESHGTFMSWVNNARKTSAATTLFHQLPTAKCIGRCVANARARAEAGQVARQSSSRNSSPPAAPAGYCTAWPIAMCLNWQTRFSSSTCSTMICSIYTRSLQGDELGSLGRARSATHGLDLAQRPTATLPSCSQPCMRPCAMRTARATLLLACAGCRQRGEINAPAPTPCRRGPTFLLSGDTRGPPDKDPSRPSTKDPVHTIGLVWPALFPEPNDDHGMPICRLSLVQIIQPAGPL